jgi:ABC-2 type transport system permease protein
MQLRSRYGLSVIKSNYRNDKKAFRKQLVIFASAAFGFLAILGSYSVLVYEASKLFIGGGQGSLLLLYAFLAILVMILFFGLIVVLGTLFFARDSEFLSTLPVHQRTVFLSKLTMVYISELAISLGLLAPVVIIYGVMANMGVLFYIKAAVIWLFVPAIPLLIASILASLFMGFIGKTRHRSMLAIIGGLAGLVLIMFAQTSLSALLRNTDPNAILQALSQPNGLINIMGASFPPSAWAVNALVSDGFEGVKYLLGFIGLSAALFVVVTFIASKIYYRGALSQLETLKKLKVVARSAYVKKQRTPLRAMFVREWKTILRSPVYAINSLTGIVLGFVVMVLPLIGTAAMSGAESEEVFGLLREANQDIVCLALAGIMAIIGSINPAASTALSREGGAFWSSTAFPVAFEKQVQSKFLFGYSIAAATAFTTGAGAVVGMGVNPLTAFFAFLFALVLLVGTTVVSLEIDLIRPKFGWNNETEAIKQNMNSLYAMLLSMLLVALLGLLAYLLFNVIAQTLLISLIIVVVAAAFSAAGYAVLMKTAAGARYEY